MFLEGLHKDRLPTLSDEKMRGSLKINTFVSSNDVHTHTNMNNYCYKECSGASDVVRYRKAASGNEMAR